MTKTKVAPFYLGHGVECTNRRHRIDISKSLLFLCRLGRVPKSDPCPTLNAHIGMCDIN